MTSPCSMWRHVWRIQIEDVCATIVKLTVEFTGGRSILEERKWTHEPNGCSLVIRDVVCRFVNVGTVVGFF
jgi:hypothetical protein